MPVEVDVRSSLVLLAVAVTLPGLAGKVSDPDEDGVPLVVTVVDADTGIPIPFAAVRESQEKELHPVNKVNGQFSTTMLYPSYNEEIPLRKGMDLVLEVTAANYRPQEVRYTMRKRNNKLMVQLQPMKVNPNWGDEPVWQFARDVPIGGKELSPEELARIEAEAAAAKAEREAQADKTEGQTSSGN